MPMAQQKGSDTASGNNGDLVSSPDQPAEPSPAPENLLTAWRRLGNRRFREAVKEWENEVEKDGQVK
jgi:hypothetical protein